MATLRDRLSVSMRGDLSAIKQAAVAVWETPRHRYYTDHTPDGHSERVIRKLDALVSLMPKQSTLNASEALVLLAAAYLHDIGMQWEGAGGETEDLAREHHHELTRTMIIGSIRDPHEFRPLGLSREFVDEVAAVASAHRRLDLSHTEFNDRRKGDETLRLRLLAALLRLGDAIDIDHHRVDIERLKEADVPQHSRLHWWRCHYIEGVDIESGVIRVECKVPSEDYEYYLRESVERELHAAVSETRDILWEFVPLHVGSTRFLRSDTQVPMDDGDFRAFRQGSVRKSGGLRNGWGWGVKRDATARSRNR